MKLKSMEEVNADDLFFREDLSYSKNKKIRNIINKIICENSPNLKFPKKIKKYLK